MAFLKKLPNEVRCKNKIIGTSHLFIYTYQLHNVAILMCFSLINILHETGTSDKITREAAYFNGMFWGLLMVLTLSVTLVYWKEQHSIKSFYSRLYGLPAGMLSLNILLPVNAIIGLYSSWAQVLVTNLLVGVLFYLLLVVLTQLKEIFSPIHYSLMSTTKTTNAQKIFLILFFALTELYCILLCSVDTSLVRDEKVIIGFYYTTYVSCPILNIIVMPIVYVACLAYNSDQLAFSKEASDGNLQRGVCSWHEKSETWVHEEAPLREEDAFLVKLKLLI
ncbi:G_PROTEIN_RECEP_F1_2 domain-containing protein [Caenorhabditis elegans]|uniref:G_PROTEIN_RECEP_F1_2 domain-containing protein n=1 Tax=Caenorhabditis elegans TaxID=6239 RepID=O17181_CAEEL|nr:G_PROTEIN_RECEP_F1_2 domain-containing protein [Caenorhabditis elegans]CCD63715.2 G_PROTEIN_RECEP_F1_2 domain-containing protein [Caenorhabditis elegans]|eukprot:NP_494081.2 Uncharacterized protein CELE_C08F1.8 [Caenorhabditis elegans]